VSKPLDFGVFITPFHPVGQSPTVALEYDLERTVALGRLGYDEVWFGEHQSGGYELIACPEVFIAAAAPSGPSTFASAQVWSKCRPFSVAGVMRVDARPQCFLARGSTVAWWFLRADAGVEESQPVAGFAVGDVDIGWEVTKPPPVHAWLAWD
jgi:hypothetical protein